MVAAQALGFMTAHHLGRLSAASEGQPLHADLFVRGHDHADGLAAYKGHQGLQDDAG
jgi:hypothetical protein